MSGNNGHLNGHSMSGDDPSGGRGHCSLNDLLDPHRARGAAGLLATAIRNGYLDIFGIDYAECKKLATELARNEKPRLKAAGLKLLSAMAKHDLELMMALDKSGRLDAATPTEIAEHRVLKLRFDTSLDEVV